MSNHLYVSDGYVQQRYVSAGIWVDWAAKIIHVPRTHMLLVQSVPTEVRELDLNQFRLDLKALEASVEGMPFLDTHSHNPPVTVGGVTLARVVEIINGYTVTFEDGQYAVNLTGANSNVGDVTNVNQVSVRSANSAGLTYSKQIEDQAFLDGRIWLDTTEGSPGTQYPLGTTSAPVNNIADAQSIATARNLPNRYHYHGYMTISPLYEIVHEDWLGDSPLHSIIELDDTNIEGSLFERIYLTGSGLGKFNINEGIITDFTNFEGSCARTGFAGTIRVPDSIASSNLLFVRGYSAAPYGTHPIFDLNDALGVSWQFRTWAGEMEFRNLTDPSGIITIDMTSGNVFIDSSCTGGTIVVRGTGDVINNSGGTTVIDQVSPIWTEAEKNTALAALTSITDAANLLLKYQENRTVIDKLNNTLTVYDDDGVTPILTFTLLNSLGSPSTDEVAERVPV